MKQVPLKHWQDPLNALFGVWLILAPWAIGFHAHTIATSNSVAVGVLLLATALGAVFVPRAWEEWTEAVLGLWMAASPWILDYSQLGGATVSAFFTGLLVLACALWVLVTDKEYRAWWTDQTT